MSLAKSLGKHLTANSRAWRILWAIFLAIIVVTGFSPAGQDQSQDGQQPGQPLGQPLGKPLGQPLGHPIGEPIGQPLGHPIGEPLGHPIGEPIGQPLGHPIGEPLGQQIGTTLGIPAGVILTFQGEWSASGTREVLPMGPNRNASTFSLSGSLILTGQSGLRRGFQSVAQGSDDGKGHAVGSCTWTDDQGDQIFSDLQGESVGSGKHVKGTITGGTGRYDSLTGRYEFDWQYLIQDEDGNVQGRAVGLQGIAEKTKVW